MAFIDQHLVAERDFNGVQIRALNVLHQRHLHALHIVGSAHKCGNLGESGQFGGAETAFAGDQLVFAVLDRAHRHRLYQPVSLDGLCQFLKSFLIKLGTRLIRIHLDGFQFDEAVATDSMMGLGICRGNVHPAKDGAQATAQWFIIFAAHVYLY